MTISVPLIAILGVVMFLAYRYQGLLVWHALVCLLCGFLVGATTAAPAIQRLLSAVVGVFTGH